MKETEQSGGLGLGTRGKLSPASLEDGLSAESCPMVSPSPGMIRETDTIVHTPDGTSNYSNCHTTHLHGNRLLCHVTCCTIYPQHFRHGPSSAAQGHILFSPLIPDHTAFIIGPSYVRKKRDLYVTCPGCGPVLSKKEPHCCAIMTYPSIITCYIVTGSAPSESHELHQETASQTIDGRPCCRLDTYRVCR